MSKFIEVHVKKIWYKNDKDKFNHEPDLSYNEPQARLVNTSIIRSITVHLRKTMVLTDKAAFVVTEDYETLAGLLEAVGIGRNEE